MMNPKRFYLELFLLFFFCTSLLASVSADEPQKRTPVVFPREQEKNRVMLGTAIGFPTGLSLIGGWFSNSLAIKISGGFNFTGWQGAQLDCSHLVWDYQSTRHDVSLTGGIFRYEDVKSDGTIQLLNQHYVGSTYSVFFDGFHIQAGFAYGIEDYSNYILLFQAGYLFKLF